MANHHILYTLAQRASERHKREFTRYLELLTNPRTREKTRQKQLRLADEALADAQEAQRLFDEATVGQGTP